MEKISNLKDFLEIINTSKKPFIVSFSANWCGPCIRSEPIYISYQEKLKQDLDFYKVDVDEGELIALSCDIESLPMYIMYKNKKELFRYTGIIDDTFVETIQNNLDKVSIDIESKLQ